jgi:hypothetical protein
MRSLIRVLGLCLIGLSITCFPGSSATPQLFGSYKITANTDLGADVRITVELNFMNGANSEVTVKSIGVRSLSMHGQVISASADLLVPAHSNAQTSLQLVIPKKDFDAWRGPHQPFVVKFQTSAGQAVTANLPMLRTK